MVGNNFDTDSLGFFRPNSVDEYSGGNSHVLTRIPEELETGHHSRKR